MDDLKILKGAIDRQLSILPKLLLKDAIPNTIRSAYDDLEKDLQCSFDAYNIIAQSTFKQPLHLDGDIDGLLRDIETTLSSFYLKLESRINDAIQLRIDTVTVYLKEQAYQIGRDDIAKTLSSLSIGKFKMNREAFMSDIAAELTEFKVNIEDKNFGLAEETIDDALCAYDVMGDVSRWLKAELKPQLFQAKDSLLKRLSS